ncbi:hypothetical protein ACLOJK_011158 [Asimina triloba]
MTNRRYSMEVKSLFNRLGVEPLVVELDEMGMISKLNTIVDFVIRDLGILDRLSFFPSWAMDSRRLLISGFKVASILIQKISHPFMQFPFFFYCPREYLRHCYLESSLFKATVNAGVV